jgi:catechol 2,3-dioxygenase-like lactoylglutathione lyase family enzyme
VKQTPIVALDHISVPVKDLKKARQFYTAALGAIGMKINMDVSSAFGMGSKKEKVFWIARDPKASGAGHYAFRVDNRPEVDAFFDAALSSGGTDNGKPGPRPNYGRNYYAAFVKDPEGNNIEVVCYAQRTTAPARAKRQSPKRAKRKAAPKQVKRRSAKRAARR